MMRNYAYIAVFVLAPAMVLLAAMGYSFTMPEPSSLQNLMVAPLSFDLGDVSVSLPAGKRQAPEGTAHVERTIYYSLTNNGQSPVAVVGAEDECGLNACMSIKLAERIVIQPGASADIRCSVSLKGRPGPFEAGASLHVDDGGLRTIRLAAHGTAVTPGEPSSR